MNTLYAYAKRYWLLLSFLGASAGTGAVYFVAVQVRASATSQDVAQQERIGQLEKALAEALEQLQKKSVDKGQLSPQEREQLKKLSDQARDLKRLQRMKNGDGTVSPGASTGLGDAGDQSSEKGTPGTSGGDVDGSGRSKKTSLTPIDPEQQIAMMQAMLDDIEASNKQRGITKRDLNKELPLVKKEEVSNATVKKDDGSRTILLKNADDASHEPTVVEKIEKSVDQKIVQPAMKKSETICNDEVAASVRRIVGDAIRGAI